MAPSTVSTAWAVTIRSTPAQADIVISGTGNDTMNGDAGSDVFIFGAGIGNDRINGFDANPSGGQDFLDISAFGITSASFAARVKIADVGADTLVSIDEAAGQTIRLVGIWLMLQATCRSRKARLRCEPRDMNEQRSDDAG
jgi:Ca2+-binding RTX toxin-like protein